MDYLGGLEFGVNVLLVDGVKNFCFWNLGKGIVVLISDLMDKWGYEVVLWVLVV